VYRRLRLSLAQASELDGGLHAERTEADNRRAAEIACHGYRIIRFWNNDVLENLEEVLETIRHALEAPPPLPTSPPRGAERGRFLPED
jgi:very-short-patch-repair endonuclease